MQIEIFPSGALFFKRLLSYISGQTINAYSFVVIKNYRSAEMLRRVSHSVKLSFLVFTHIYIIIRLCHNKWLIFDEK